MYARQFWSRKSLNGRTPSEALFGETEDISVFRMPFWNPIWFHNPSKKMPKSKMQKGCLLGIAHSVGDRFTYVILPMDEKGRYKTPLSRSVVRKRHPREDDIYVTSERLDPNTFYFETKDGRRLEGDTDLHPVQPTPEPEEHDTQASAVSSVGSSDVDFLEPEERTEETRPCSPPLPVVTVDPHEDDNETSVFPEVKKVPMVSQNDDDGTAATSALSDDDTIGPEAEEEPESLNAHAHHDEGTDEVHAIVGHMWRDGQLFLQVEFVTGETHEVAFDLLQDDEPIMCAKYILSNDVDSSRDSVALQRYSRWARVTLRGLRRAVRRAHRLALYDVIQEEERLAGKFHVRRTTQHPPPKKKKKPGRNNRQQGNIKYGVKVPATTRLAFLMDKDNKNQAWKEAMDKEINALIDHDCFEFMPPGFKPDDSYQECPLRMIFDVKQCGKYKARLVAGGHKVDAGSLSTRATVVKGVSVRLLDVIAHHHGLKTLCGDVGNAFINAYTKEKVWARAGPEFGSRAGSIVLIKKALYGLTTSAERWRACFADFIRKLGFVPSRYDRDVWLQQRPDGSGYDYMCTHVDDFKIVAKDPWSWMKQIQAEFLVKSAEEPKYYLGNDYRYDEPSNMWVVGTTTYVKECLAKVERTHQELKKRSTPLPTKDCNPELDDSPLLNFKRQREYQALLGMGQWLVTIGRFDLCFAMSSLSRFGTCPREGHLKLLLHVFGYLKKWPNKAIAVDSRPKPAPKEARTFEADFLADYDYAIPDHEQDYGEICPKAIGTALEVSVYFDSDHAHDKKTRRSISGILGFVGRTPVSWFSKRQGAVASSTYEAEFSAMRTATEEVKSLRFMLRCLGIPVTGPSNLIGDNLSVIMNASLPQADLKKKHVALSYHIVRESVASSVCDPLWLDGKLNPSDILTKQIGSTEFIGHVHDNFWKPTHRTPQEQ